ncbi:hypothetical protein HBB16_13890 [Pseudonocardia sp. MCCB 268]|nr:hypothetical protein [Pseudonocardia cytotoxica]
MRDHADTDLDYRRSLRAADDAAAPHRAPTGTGAHLVVLVPAGAPRRRRPFRDLLEELARRADWSTWPPAGPPWERRADGGAAAPPHGWPSCSGRGSAAGASRRLHPAVPPGWPLQHPSGTGRRSTSCVSPR